MNYAIHDETKLNTRYSELTRARPGSVERLVQERHGDISRFESEIMAFGTLRHSMWEEESRETGKLPVCFGIDELVDAIEQDYATEIFRDVVVYMRPDAIWLDGGVANDFKTATLTPGESILGSAAKRYKSSLQLTVYAYLLSFHGHPIKKRRYLVELWDQARENVLGYDIYEEKVSVSDFARAKKWLQQRCELLAFAEQQYQIQQGTM